MKQNQNRVKELEGVLRDGGVRVTRQRAAILKILATAEDHPDASELHRRAKELDATVSLSTVYRTLSALEQAGPTTLVEHAVLPINFACPNFIRVDREGAEGSSDAASPWSAAVAAQR